MRHNRLIVTFTTRILTHYRVPFHEALRSMLAERAIDYHLVHGQPNMGEAAKGDLATLPWADTVTNQALLGHGKLVWQPILKHAAASDLIILGQENQLLVNYPLQLLPARLRPRIALWGHGRNFQSRNPEGAAERWKRFWAMRADWWFGYTEASRTHIRTLGFPDDRITVANNSVDTTFLREAADDVGALEIEAVKDSLGIKGKNVAIFVGGLYPDKRLGFLIEAADRVRARMPDFTLVIVGGGIGRPEIETAAATRPWLVVAGPRFGREKAALMRAAKLFLMPGLVGLAVLDAAAFSLPIVTTAYPYHSPEIAYLEDGVTGLIVPRWQDATAYADAVVSLMLNDTRCSAMAAAARTISYRYRIEAMAERFRDGIIAALAAPKRR